MTVTQKEILKYFLFLLGKKDYSTQELISKGQKKSYPNNDLLVVTDYLKTQGFLSDQRLAENLILKYSKTRGKNWLTLKFIQRKIPEMQNLIEIFYSGQNINYPELKQKIQKRYSVENWSEIDAKTLTKIYGFLNRRGFKNPEEIIKSWQASDFENSP